MQKTKLPICYLINQVAQKRTLHLKINQTIFLKYYCMQMVVSWKKKPFLQQNYFLCNILQVKLTYLILCMLLLFNTTQPIIHQTLHCEMPSVHAAVLILENSCFES